MPRVQAPTGKQAVRIFFHVIGNKLVHAAGETDDLRGHVVDEHGKVNSAVVHALCVHLHFTRLWLLLEAAVKHRRSASRSNHTPTYTPQNISNQASLSRRSSA